MAVLVEGISVVTRRDAIQAKLVGGWQAFLGLVPNSTLCTDGVLARVGFMSPGGVGEFIDSLESVGLTFMKQSDVAEDISVVDMLTGPTVVTPWLEFAKLNVQFEEGEPKRKVSVCWFYDSPRDMGAGTYMSENNMELAVPDDWTYADSLTEKHTFVPTNNDA